MLHKYSDLKESAVIIKNAMRIPQLYRISLGNSRRDGVDLVSRRTFSDYGFKRLKFPDDYLHCSFHNGHATATPEWQPHYRRDEPRLFGTVDLVIIAVALLFSEFG